MKQGLDYVLVSYYEDDCNNLQPDWQTVFDRLGQMFPNSKLGMGEVGTSYADRKQTYITRYYDNMPVSHPRFVGGYFWWYFNQDMVPYTKALWSYFNSVISDNPIPR